MNKDLLKKLINAGIEEAEAKKEISILYKEFGKENLNKIKNIVEERIKTRTPLQYLLGKAYFMDFEVKVNNHVLIPRPETEILVEETVRRGMPRHALDIGTGSGIIAIALAKLIPNIKIIAIDIKKEIIALAKENATKNNVADKIQFKICDVFSKDTEDLFKSHKIDLIISNPPYVKENEPARRRDGEPAIQPEILHEPKIALYGSLIYYERIIRLALSTQMLALEIDPPLVNDLKSLLKKEGLNNFEIVKDYNNLDRCLFIKF
ncbi:MAG: peptide chain release factor N(5)-glutamine methyltransferase [Candidatus Melainabacteria bacterium]|nr:peptide chain release factor N(5)-glutamine methyltransferase [Candidatus Melainabacteria bacterium]